MSRRILALLAAVVVLVVGTAGPAVAAVRVVTSVPAAGATVTKPPDEVRLTFDQAVSDLASTVQVHTVGAGSSYANLYNSGLVRSDGADALVQSVRLLPPGSYEVAWTASAGGTTATTSGSFRFTVAAPREAKTGPGQWAIIVVMALIIAFLAVSLGRRRLQRREAAQPGGSPRKQPPGSPRKQSAGPRPK